MKFKPPVQRLHPNLRRLRDDQGVALRLMLKQIRSCNGVWSNGTEIFQGQRLVDLRRNATQRLINMRTDERKPQMERMARNVLRGASYLGQQKDESTDDFLVRVIEKYTGSDDTGSRERKLVALRILRRQFSDRLADLPLHLSVNAQELPFVVKSLNSKGMVLRAQLRDGSGVVCSEGAPVVFEANGTARVRVGSFVSEDRISMHDVRPRRKSDLAKTVILEMPREDNSPDY